MLGTKEKKMETTNSNRLGSDISWIEVEDMEAEAFTVKTNTACRLDQQSSQHSPQISSIVSAIDRTSVLMSDTDAMDSLQYKHTSSDDSKLRRRIIDTTAGTSDNGGGGSDHNNPFIDAVCEEILNWFPNMPLRSKDQLYFNMIQSILTLKEVVRTPIPTFYQDSLKEDTESHGFFDFLSKAVSAVGPRVSSSERIVNEAIYWIHSDHIYWSILYKNFNNDATLTAIPSGPKSCFLAIPKLVMDDIIEFVWNTLVKTGRVQNPIASYR